MPLRHKDTKVHKEDKWVILIIFVFLSALVPLWQQYSCLLKKNLN